MNAELSNLKKYVNVIGYNAKYGVNGVRLPHVKYIAQKGGYREIEKAKKRHIHVMHPYRVLTKFAKPDLCLATKFL